MEFLFVYRRGAPLPEERVAENRQAWRSWNAGLNEAYGIRAPRGGMIVSADGAAPYDGNITGVSIVEAESLDEAIETAKGSPSVQFGGDVIVIPEFE